MTKKKKKNTIQDTDGELFKNNNISVLIEYPSNLSVKCEAIAITLLA